MVRSDVIRSITDFLVANYTGPVSVRPEADTETISLPYAVVRIGSAEQLYPGQAEIWDMNILIAVRHDANVTDAETAEENASGVFAMFDDPDDFFAASDLVWTALEPVMTEAGIVENHWQHVAAFQGIIAPPED